MASGMNDISWPGWEVVSVIGRGSFGTVYKIQRDVFGDIEEAALKVITIPHDENEIDYLRCSGVSDNDITQTFHQQVGDIAREYKLMSQMRDNVNIVRCDDFRDIHHDDGLGWDIYIKMELLTPLMKALDQVQMEEQIIHLGLDLCNALIACQKRNIIHRDIKPQNVFVSKDGQFKLGDFGIARTLDHTTYATPRIGTYSYMAPEVERKEAYGRTADIYSLGLLLYWLLNERRSPFMPLPPTVLKFGDEEASRQRRLSGEPLPVPRYGSAALQAVVLKACAYKPEDRYDSAQEMYLALESALCGDQEDDANLRRKEKEEQERLLLEKVEKDHVCMEWEEQESLAREREVKERQACEKEEQKEFAKISGFDTELYPKSAPKKRITGWSLVAIVIVVLFTALSFHRLIGVDTQTSADMQGMIPSEQVEELLGNADSASMNTIAINDGVPSVPDNLRYEQYTDTSIWIYWDECSNAEMYEVQYFNRLDARWDAVDGTVSGTSYKSTGLVSYMSYEYRIRAVNEAGASNWTYITCWLEQRVNKYLDELSDMVERYDAEEDPISNAYNQLVEAERQLGSDNERVMELMEELERKEVKYAVAEINRYLSEGNIEEAESTLEYYLEFFPDSEELLEIKWTRF